MDFDFSDDQESLRDAVRRWVDKGFAFERRHALAKAGGATRAVYAELAELGLAGLAVAEAHGGLGQGAVEAMVVCEELGRGLVNAPYAEAALMAPRLLAAAPADLQADWLPRIADGSALVVPALHERGSRWRWTHVAAQATEAADGSGLWHVDATKCVVPAGDEADAWLVPARIGASARPGGFSGADALGSLGLFLVERDAAGVRVAGYPTQDGARAADLFVESAPARRVCTDAAGAIEWAVDVGCAAQCAESVGLMDKLVAVTVDYMNQRKQFGVPIASFQALRHRIADVKMQLELARSMSYYATLKLGEPAPERRRAIAQARVQLGNSTRFVGQQCIQLHGGIGCTDDTMASHYFKRLTMIELGLGDTLHHLGEVAARMQDSAGVFA